MTLKTDIDQIAVDAGKLHDIVHGGPTAVVATDGGSVKSVAKAIADLEAQIINDADSYLDQCQDEVVLATAQAQTATNQAAAAAGSALSAASVVAQDLSAIDRTVFASTTLVAVCRYNTKNDTDEGAWRKRCQHTAWYNQALAGNYLGEAVNEAEARTVSGATTGSYYHNTTDGKFYKLSTGAGQTETFRGNRAEHPAEVLITAETSRVIIWDLTQAGCPMWAVLVPTGIWVAGRTATSVAARNGRLVIGTSQGVIVWHIVSDLPTFVVTSGTYSKGSRDFNASAGTPKLSDAAIVNDAVSSVAITVLPNAPVDVATGLPIPTIAVATNGGVSVIKDDGNVWDIVPDGGAAYIYAVAFTPDHRLMFETDGAGTRRTVRVDALPTADVTHVYTTKNTSLEAYTNGQTFAGDLTYLGGTTSLKAIPQAIGTEAGVTLLHRNPATPASGMVAYLAKDYPPAWQVGASKGLWLCSNVAEVVTGVELVTGGDFATDSSANWLNVGNAQNITAAAGALRFESTGGSSIVVRSVSNNGVVANLVSGKTYTLSAKLTQTVGAGGATYQLRVYDSTGTSLLGTASITTVTGVAQKVSITFTATSSLYPLLYPWVTTATALADAFELDDLSIRLADVDRSVKAKGLQAFGTLTKAPVASGAQVMGYSGWSVTAYYEQPYNADLDFGTGDFHIIGWLKEAPNSAAEYLFHRGYWNGSAWVGAAIVIYINASGTLAAQITDDAYVTYDQIATAVAIDDSIPRLVSLIRRGSNLELWIDGTKAAADAAITAATASLSNGSATMSIGRLHNGTQPLTNGAPALWRAGPTAPTAEQIKHIYETEKALFEAGSQGCLAGTSNAVVGLKYDDETDILSTWTAGHRSDHKGLVRVASEASTIGTFVGGATGGGVIAQIGSTGCDVYVPAYQLREELLRSEEHTGNGIEFFPFTATASQTTFTLNVGWEIMAIYQQGLIKTETTAWSKSFDGFKWSAVLVTGATVSDLILIMARRVSK